MVDMYHMVVRYPMFSLHARLAVFLGVALLCGGIRGKGRERGREGKGKGKG